MSEVSCCLLCLNSCSDYKCLCDADGVYDMELYNITVKYFDTMFITETTKNQLPVVCFKCWQCMFEFNNFQCLIITAHEKLSKDSLKLSSEAKGDQRADKNEFQYELGKMDEVSIKMEITTEPTCIFSVKMEDSLQLLQVAGDPRSNRNESPSELGLMDKGSIKKEINADDIEPNRHIKEEPAEHHSCDENSQSANLNYNDSDPEGCEESTEPEVFLSGEESDGNSLLQQSTLKNPEQHSSADNSAGSHNDFINRNATRGKKLFKSAQEIDKMISKWKSEFECAICQSVVSSFPLLRAHTNLKHPQMKCQISCCQRLHAGPSIIAQHANFHMDPQCFKCHLCSKSFASMAYLSRHRRSVHSTPKAVVSAAPRHKCRVCGKTFARKDDWEEHEACHMGIRLYTCLLCSKTFTHRTLVYRHNRISHSAEWLSIKGTTKPSFTKANLDDVRKSLNNFPSTC